MYIQNYLQFKRKIINISPSLARLKGNQMQRKYLSQNKEPGLSYQHIFHDIESRFFYFDPSVPQAKLRYGQGGLVDAINETLEACYPKTNRRK